jgi:hypothetical protein
VKQKDGMRQERLPEPCCRRDGAPSFPVGLRSSNNGG